MTNKWLEEALSLFRYLDSHIDEALLWSFEDPFRTLARGYKKLQQDTIAFVRGDIEGLSQFEATVDYSIVRTKLEEFRNAVGRARGLLMDLERELKDIEDRITRLTRATE